MTNQVIKINDKDYIISFNINTFCLMESNGFNVMSINESDFGLSAYRELFYYGLLRYHKKGMTQDKAGELISDFLENDGNMTELTEKVMSALFKSLGVKQEEEGK